MATDHNLKALITESIGGKRESSRLLYEQLVDKVFAFVRYRTGSHEEATDITQDVFIDLFQALPRFTYHSDAQFYAFVFVITRRKLSRHYADSSRETITFDEHSMSTDDGTVSHELESDVARALKSLERTTEEIVVLHHFGRYTFGEIALLLNMTESAVRVRHHRALKLLGTLLQE